jgi:O-antigen/teichoic acid export membrane protein
VGGTPESHQTALDSLGRGTAVLIAGTFALLLLSFLGRVELARRLSVEDFGDFNLGLSLAGLLSLLALLGLHQAIARTIAERPDPALRRLLIRWAAVVTTIAATVTSVAVYFLAPDIAAIFNSGNNATLTVVFQMFSVTIGLTLLCTFLGSVFQGFEDAVPYAFLNQGVQPGAFLVFLVILIYFHLTLTTALVAWVLSNIVTFVALVIYTFRRLPRHLPKGPVATTLPSGLWALSLSLWGVTTLIYITGYADTLILGVFRPETQVGIYSAVLTLGRLILVAAAAVTFIFLPVSARLWGEGNVESIRSTYLTAGRWVLIFTAPLFLVFALFPTDSLTTVFGSSYAPGALALIIVTVSALASVAFGPVNATMAGLAMTRPLIIATAVSAVLNIVLSFTLIPTYGLIGAAIAWSAARIAYPAAGAYALADTHRIHSLDREFLLPLGIALGVGIPLFGVLAFLPHPVWIVYPLYFVGVGIFVGAILITHSVHEGDLVMIGLGERVLGRKLPRLRAVLEHYSAPPRGPSAAPPNSPLPPRGPSPSSGDSPPESF